MFEGSVNGPHPPLGAILLHGLHSVVDGALGVVGTVRLGGVRFLRTRQGHVRQLRLLPFVLVVLAGRQAVRKEFQVLRHPDCT